MGRCIYVYSYKKEIHIYIYTYIYFADILMRPPAWLRTSVTLVSRLSECCTRVGNFPASKRGQGMAAIQVVANRATEHAMNKCKTLSYPNLQVQTTPPPPPKAQVSPFGSLVEAGPQQTRNLRDQHLKEPAYWYAPRMGSAQQQYSGRKWSFNLQLQQTAGNRHILLRHAARNPGKLTEPRTMNPESQDSKT